MERLAPAWRPTLLAQKLVQLTMPGVADTYQGTELWDLSLVDPDNRRPVDYDERRRLLAWRRWRRPTPPSCASWRRLLRLRRDQPELFLPDASYRRWTPVTARRRVRPPATPS